MLARIFLNGFLNQDYSTKEIYTVGYFRRFWRNVLIHSQPYLNYQNKCVSVNVVH